MNVRILVAAAAVFIASGPLASAADFVVVNTAPEGPGSLRQAILDANAFPGADRIVFNIPGAGVRTIDVSDNILPPITDAVTIDGYTQPGAKPNELEGADNAVVLIRIDGGLELGAPHLSPRPPPIGISIEADNCVVRGLMITRFAQCCPWSSMRSGGYGIAVRNSHCVIEGNFIGTDGSISDKSLGNTGAGISIQGSSNRIGGTAPASRNVISGNRIGIQVSGGETLRSDNVVIAGNQIGTDEDGPTPASGNGIGIALANSSTIDRFQNTIIGGTTASHANLIAGNDIGIRTASTHTGTQQTSVANGVIIQGNVIGARRNTATSASSNAVGIELFGSEHVIGGIAPGAGNVISSNGHGIKMNSVRTSPSSNSIIANEIEGNSMVGLSVIGTDHLIGGLDAGAGNRIAYNQAGVVVLPNTGGQAARNRILSNIIHSNINPTEIDLGGDGPTSNDFGDGDTGANRLQNFPTITDVQTSGGSTVIRGGLSTAPSSTYTVQLFGRRADTQAHVLLTTQTLITDASGAASFQVIYPAPLVANTIAGTATDSEGNTSELTPANGPVQLANISTRGFVGTDAKILIGGFIVRSEQPKKVGVRALGPSVNVPNRLADPYLELYDSNGALLAKNDDWKAGQQQEVIDSGLAPSSDVESAVIATLAPGNYTAQVSGVNGSTGVGIVEVYDLDRFPESSGRLVNISTRALVGTEDNILIGGLIVHGDAAARVAARAIGPDLNARGVPDALQDPTLEMRDASGELIAENDNWRENQNEPLPEGLQPDDDRDAALVVTVAPALYTAIVRGKDATTGVALVEFYDLKN